MELDRFVDGVNANPHLTRLAVAASGLALDRFVDGVNANPHLTRLAVAAWGLALDRFVDGVNANPPRKTARTRKPHDIQRLATTQPRSAVRQPAVVRDTKAVPREPSMVPRPTNGQRRAAGVSPPWFVNGVCNCNATNFRVSREHARSPFHGGLTPPRS